MVDISDEELDRARQRGEELWLAEPRATSARYDRKHDRIVVKLTNGSTFTFPPRLAEALQGAGPDELAEVEVVGEGFALHWENIDQGITVPGLLAGIFGTRKYMAQLAGRATSPAKAAAARANGKKGGRPKKAAAS